MGYWLVDGVERYDDVDDVCDTVFDVDNYDPDDSEVDDYINDGYCEHRIIIGGTEFYPADIVRNCDEYLYAEFRSEYANYLAESDRDAYYSGIENMEDGDEEYINDYTIKYYSEEPEEEVDEDDFWKSDEEEVDEEEEIIIKTLMEHFQTIGA